MTDMNQNIVILIVVLVAVNLILITIAVLRSMLRKDTRRTGASYDEGITRRPVAAGVSSPLVPTPGSLPATSRTDPLTGLLTLNEWNRIVADEEARVSRYRHTATVVIIELDGFERLIATLGREAGDRVLPALADALSRNARAADHLARLGPSRFGVLLPETAEVEAINFVERVRQACDLWLESGAIALHLSMGWASPGPESSLADAIALAQERMFAEQRRAERLAKDIEVDDLQPINDIEGSPSPA
jgi:diguanylate cyclase (GGDEF)-like protein